MRLVPRLRSPAHGRNADMKGRRTKPGQDKVFARTTSALTVGEGAHFKRTGGRVWKTRPRHLPPQP